MTEPATISAPRKRTAPVTSLSVERQMECQPRLVRQGGRLVWQHNTDADWLAYQDHRAAVRRGEHLAKIAKATEPKPAISKPQRGRKPRTTASGASQAVAFAEWLTQALATAGLTVTELSQRSGLKRTSISRWAHGYGCPQPESCERLAHALGVPAHDALDAAGKA